MVTKKKKVHLIGSTAIAVLAVAAACGKKSKSSDDEDEETTATTTSGSVTASNALAAVYPQSLALAIFPQTTGAALTEDTVSDPNAGKNVDDKIALNQKRLKGEGDCFDPSQFKPMKPSNSVTCYEFDVDMNPSTITDNVGTRNYGTTNGTVGGTVGGTDTTNTESCMVAFARTQVEDSVQQVDRALAMVSGMLCQAKKEGLATDLPAAAGDVLDLSTAFGKGNAGLTGATAKITRLADVDGNPVYRSDITATGPDGKKLTVNLVHSPGANDTGKGTLSFLRPMGGGQANDPNNSANKNMALSINYSREQDDAGTKRMRFEVRRAAIVNTITPFDDSGLVNYAGLPADATNSQVHAINYVAFDINPETNAGNLSYWMNPGGSYNESARGFLFNISANSDGSLAGCGISGATSSVSIRKALAEPSDTNALKPTRYWHPKEDQNTNTNKNPAYSANEGNFITQQCFSQNATSGIYTIDAAKTTDTARGYDVLQGSASNVVPPTRPKAELKGDFRPKE